MEQQSASATLRVFAIERDIVIVEGSDARSYLQTQLTQDVMTLGLGQARWSFILDPQSAIEAFVRVTRIGQDRLTLDTEAGFGDAVLSRLDGLLFRTDARFSQARWPGLAWRGQGARAMSVDAPIVGAVPLVGIEALDVVGPKVVVPPDAPVGEAAELERRRVEGGWPSMAFDIPDSTTPAMTGLVDITVSFDKGCYTGQELVARTYHRGAAPTRRLVAVRSDDLIDAGAAVLTAGESIGTVTSSHDGVGLAYVARAVETPLEAEVNDIVVRVSDLPSRVSAVG